MNMDSRDGINVVIVRACFCTFWAQLCLADSSLFPPYDPLKFLLRGLQKDSSIDVTADVLYTATFCTGGECSKHVK